MINAAIKSRLYGCAVGSAVGDALGMPLEFGPAVPTSRLVRVMHRGRLPAGSFTDDTEMALVLAESLLETVHLDGANLADHFLGWYRERPDDIGNQTRTVLGMLAAGLSWEQASQKTLLDSPNNAGNGSLMHNWPIAIAGWHDPQRLAEESALQSRVTHPQPDCIAACVFANRVISALITGSSRSAAIEQALQQTQMSVNLQNMIQQAAEKKREQLPNTGWVLHTIQSAVWGLLTTDSFEEALIQVANLGADADTAAAVTGAMAGAAYGLESIPTDWRMQLRGEWPLHSERIWHEADLLALVDQIICAE